MRYFESLSLAARTVHQRLARICFADPEQHTVLVAVRWNQKSREEEILGVARLSKFENSQLGELALLIADEFQGYGLGTELLRRLLQAAQEQHITRITAEMLRDNVRGEELLKKFGFTLRLLNPRFVRAVRTL